MFATRPFDAGLGYLWGDGLGDYAWPPKPKEELPAETRDEKRLKGALARLVAADAKPMNDPVAAVGDEVVVGIDKGFERAVVLDVDDETMRAVRVDKSLYPSCAACVKGLAHHVRNNHTCPWGESIGGWGIETAYSYCVRYYDEAIPDEEDVDEGRVRLWSPNSEEVRARPRPVYLGQPTDDDHADDADFNTGQSARSLRYAARNGEGEDDEVEAGVYYDHETQLDWRLSGANCVTIVIDQNPEDPELVPRSVADSKRYLERARDKPLYELHFMPQYRDNTGTPNYLVLHEYERATNKRLRKGTLEVLQRHLRSHNLDWYKKHFPSDESCAMDWLDHTWTRVYVHDSGHDRLDAYKITLRGRLPGEPLLNIHLTRLEVIAEHGLW